MLGLSMFVTIPCWGESASETAWAAKYAGMLFKVLLA
jgi:hypothetical protein